MGGKCGCCDYDKCIAALELHHLDPSEKEFPTGGMIASPMSWDRIVAELRKCVMLCANCHREVHAGVRDIPEDITRFDESFSTYDSVARPKVEPLRTACPICGKQKPRANAYVCSVECKTAYRQKIDWSKIDLLEMSKTMSNMAIGKKLGVSDVTIHKRLKKLREG